MMIEKNAFIKSCKVFSYNIRNSRNSALHLGDSLVLGATVLGDPIIIDSHHFNSLRLLSLPPPKEIAILSFLYHYIQPKMVCADIGAGTGYYSMILGRLAGPEGKIYSYEAHQDCYHLLKRNILLNGFKSIHYKKMAAGVGRDLEKEGSAVDFVHISLGTPLADLYQDIQHCVHANAALALLCHIDPAELKTKPETYTPFFQQLHQDGFEGYLFPTLNFLDSPEQLTNDSSIKSILLSRQPLWTNNNGL